MSETCSSLDTALNYLRVGKGLIIRGSPSERGGPREPEYLRVSLWLDGAL